MILAIAAISLNLILGYGGLVSFGHAAYLGIGAYAVGILGFYGVSNGWLQSWWRSAPRRWSRSPSARCRSAPAASTSS